MIMNMCPTWILLPAPHFGVVDPAMTTQRSIEVLGIASEMVSRRSPGVPHCGCGHGLQIDVFEGHVRIYPLVI